MYNNYQKLLNMKFKNYYLLFCLLILLVLFIIFIFNYEVYSKQDFLAIYKNNYLYIDYDLKYSDTVANAKNLYIDDKFYNCEVIKLSDILYDETNLSNYQEAIINIDCNLKDNEVVIVSFYYKKEKIYKKIIKLVKEGIR